MTHATVAPAEAALLGVVEGLSEFLPISSTGHLILTSALFGHDPQDPGLGAFLIVIQAGALLAVMGLYRNSIARMLEGVAGKNPEGLRLAINLTIGFVPIAIAGLLLESRIKGALFTPVPVAAALGLGGVAMIGIERWQRARAAREPAGARELSLESVTWRGALLIGLIQCLALWPGTSRSMVTLLGGMMIGLKPREAAKFSFLLALPTLGAATVYDALRHGKLMMEVVGPAGLVLGFGLSCLVAALAIQGFLAYLTRRGLAPFAIYRIILAALVLFLWNP